MKRLKYLALATLVAFGACDNGGGNKITTPVTGTISGTVSIEATGASGVTVTLSSGTTATTDGSGNYSFSNVPAGAYTVSISGFPSDATFATSAKAAVIASAAQVVTVDFSGSYIRTSAIIGSVKDGSGAALSGVTVAVSGPGTSASKTTDNTGQTDPFTGLRAGAYTVTISGYDATNYTCATTSQSVTLATGELQVVPFTCTLKTTASISGSLFLDEAAPQDSVFESSLEKRLTVANVPILLEGGTVNDTMTVMTDANGGYSFPNLAAGTYRVTYKGTAADVPSSVAMSGASSEIVTVTAGAQATVDFPFLITKQTIDVYAFLGTDAKVSTMPGPGIAPIKGWKIDLYDTDANAKNHGSSGRLGQVTTDANGRAAFTFLRSADKNPAGNASDNIVFARSNTLPNATYAMNGENIIEIHFSSADSLGMAPDTFDALYGQLVVKVHAEESDYDTLANWTMLMRANKDSAAANRIQMSTDANGNAYYTVTPAVLAGLGTTDGSLPDTLWFRLQSGQPNANGHAFVETPSAVDATVAGQLLKFIWNGTVLPSDTIDAGSEMVSYKDANLSFQVHHEVDDSTNVPTYTAGDNNALGPFFTKVALYRVHPDGTKTLLSTVAPAVGTGLATFSNLMTDSTYEAHARSTDTTSVVVLNDTTITAMLDGSDQTYIDSTLAGSAGASSFAVKAANDSLTGFIRGHDGSTISGIVVTLTPTADNIQGSPMMVDTTGGSGKYVFTGLREGPYQVQVTGIPGKWEFFDTVATNTSATTATPVLSGAGDHQRANFVADKMDTKISGLVFNDRDLDNTQDPTDPLPGAVMVLSQNDSVVAMDTTSSNGAYSFSNLREGTYKVQWQSGTPNSDQSVLRALNTDSVMVTTTASANVGTTTPVTLPEWNYNTTSPAVAGPADFLFLADNTIAKGTVQDSVSGKGVAGMTVSLRRCDASSGAGKPPVAVTAAIKCTSYLGTTMTTVTDSTGTFMFNNLQEGVYEITPQPGTLGSYTFSDPAQELYLQQNPADVESNATTPFVVGHP